MNNWIVHNLSGVGTVKLNFDDSKRVFVLLGTNGVGKTKTLEALFLTFLTHNIIFKNYIKSKSWPFPEGLLGLSQVEIDDEVVFKNGLVHPLRTEFERQLSSRPVIFLGAENRSSIETAGKHTANLGVFKERQELYFDNIFKALKSHNIKALGMSENIHQWFLSRAQSVNPYQRIEDNRKVEIDTLLELLNVIDSRIDARTLRIDGRGRVFLLINQQDKEISELSSGFTSLLKIMQSIVSGYAAFTNEVNIRHVGGVVIIDEIESHLHVGWQSQIIPKLKELLPNTIFYIATHSPLVLSQLEEGEAYLLERDEDGVVRSKVIDSPNKRVFESVIKEAFGVNLSELKRKSMEHTDQSNVKKRLLDLLSKEQGES